MTASRENRGGSFRDTADDYERGRPSYPMEAVRWLVDDARRVVDLGAGTGKLTEGLVRLAPEIIAVEPEPSMLTKLRSEVTNAHAVCGRAAAIPVVSEWADCVTVAQAFHWFDDEPALREMARVLSARGRLGLVWNVRDESVSWVAELVQITGRDKSHATRSTLKSRPHFDAFESTTFRFAHKVSPSALVAHVRSRSHVAGLSHEEQKRLVRAVLDLCDEHPDLAGRSSFEFPYLTEAFRSRKEST
jgi:SAM-dependent methyltransferase